MSNVPAAARHLDEDRRQLRVLMIEQREAPRAASY